MGDNFVIRSASPDDAEALLLIYKPYVERTAVSFEYKVPDLEEFRHRIREHLKSYPYLVAEEGGRAVGYAYAGQFNPREAYRPSAETSIYVDWNSRRKGIGKSLYVVLEDDCRKRGITNLYACVSYPYEKEDEYLTLDSVRFHEKEGYVAVGRFHGCGYKFGRWYDMLWMEKIIGKHD
jgi:phosphinothricin acetyltransferase